MKKNKAKSKTTLAWGIWRDGEILAETYHARFAASDICKWFHDKNPHSNMKVVRVEIREVKTHQERKRKK